MNSLEFIDQVITQMKSLLEHTKTMLKPQNYEISEDLKKHYEQDKKNIEEQILHLHQIKSELEAWEICKNKLNLKVQTEEAVTEGFCMKGYWLLVEQYPYTQTTIIEQEEYEVLKKALEVK